MPIWRGNTYRFTVTSANATVGATYTNNTQTFTVTATITAGTVLFCTGTGAPTASGTLTRTSGTGDATITFSANVAPNVNWGTATNWDTGVLPSDTLAGTDAIFDSASLECTVNITTAVCRNLNFTGYTRTITMTNGILVGSSSTSFQGHSVTLWPTMGISGAGAISTRANGTTTLTSNGRQWPNALGINNSNLLNNSVAIITDNWTVQNLFLGPGANHAMTLQGAFTITVNGNFNVQMTGGNSSRVNGVAGSLTTIKLAGTGTWSAGTTFTSTATAATGFGVSVVIDTPGTITIANNCYFGGSVSVAGTTFTYVTGTVIHNGTFHLLGNQGGNGYGINLNGDPSVSATTTSSTGVNFNNLSFTTFSTGGSPGACAITGNVCVVGNLGILGLVAAKGQALSTGGTIYVKGNLTINGGMRLQSSTVVVLQGTGSWTENGITGFWGVSWQVQINTTGTITMGATVGLSFFGSITYTAGTLSFVPGSQLYITAGAQLYGLGSGGIIVPNLIHVTGAALGNLGSRVYFFDSVNPQFINFSLTGAGSNNAWDHSQTSTIGWTCDNLSCSLNSSVTNTSFVLQNSKTYIVRSSLSLLAWNNANDFTMGPPSNGFAIFTLLPGASQDLYYMDGGNSSRAIDSSGGQTIYTRGGTISPNTINWKPWDFPKTRHSTSIS